MSQTRENLNAATLTDPGQMRIRNEDAVYQHIRQTTYHQEEEPAGLFIVCDGLGGHSAGDMASQLAIETAAAELGPLLVAEASFPLEEDGMPSKVPLRWLRTAVNKANQVIRQQAHANLDEMERMGTTMTAVLVIGSLAYIAHVGDTRAYRLRQERIMQITHDHSLVAELANQGHIDETEIATHPRNNLLSRALGLAEHVEPDLHTISLQAGDRMLLCSDGLWKAFPRSSELGTWLGTKVAPPELCLQLVDEANRRDGSDNISVVIVEIGQRTTHQETQVIGREGKLAYDELAIAH